MLSEQQLDERISRMTLTDKARQLAQVTVSTAAGNHEIPGLLVEDADELRDLIATQARLAQEDL